MCSHTEWNFAELSTKVIEPWTAAMVLSHMIQGLQIVASVSFLMGVGGCPRHHDKSQLANQKAALNHRCSGLKMPHQNVSTMCIPPSQLPSMTPHASRAVRRRQPHTYIQSHNYTCLVIFVYTLYYVMYVTHWYTNNMLKYIITWQTMGPLHIRI